MKKSQIKKYTRAVTGVAAVLCVLLYVAASYPFIQNDYLSGVSFETLAAALGACFVIFAASAITFFVAQK